MGQPVLFSYGGNETLKIGISCYTQFVRFFHKKSQRKTTCNFNESEKLVFMFDDNLTTVLDKSTCDPMNSK